MGEAVTLAPKRLDEFSSSQEVVKLLNPEHEDQRRPACPSRCVLASVRHNDESGLYVASLGKSSDLTDRPFDSRCAEMSAFYFDYHGALDRFRCRRQPDREVGNVYPLLVVAGLSSN